MNGLQALVGRDQHQPTPTATAPSHGSALAQLEAELEAQEPVMGAAIMAATAFRLRDESGLIETLRRLAQAVAAHEAMAARRTA